MTATHIDPALPALVVELFDKVIDDFAEVNLAIHINGLWGFNLLMVSVWDLRLRVKGWRDVPKIIRSWR